MGTAGFRVQGSGFRVQGSGFKSRRGAGGFSLRGLTSAEPSRYRAARAKVLTVLMIASGFSVVAEAQSNSLFGASPAPAVQSTNGAVEILLPAPPTLFYPNLGKDDDVPAPNEVLLATSLFAVAAPKPRKIKVNDLITVIIREEKKSSSDSDLKREKKWEIAAELKKWIRLNEQHKLIPQVFPMGNPAIDLEYDDKYEGKGKVGRKDSLITRITAKVIDVKPNGLLMIEAHKEIGVDLDYQKATLTGMCRSADVTADNTILSTQLADARIDIQHSGPARDAARRGWLARVWDFIRPL